MDILISGKHVEIEEDLKLAAEEQAKKLAADFELQKLVSFRLILSVERNWQIADAQLNGKHFQFNAKAVSDNMRASVAKAFDKLNKQMRRFIEKTKTVATKADPQMKEKIWTSSELKEQNENVDFLDDEILD